jgi:hypothetical protein
MDSWSAVTRSKQE